MSIMMMLMMVQVVVVMIMVIVITAMLMMLVVVVTYQMHSFLFLPKGQAPGNGFMPGVQIQDLQRIRSHSWWMWTSRLQRGGKTDTYWCWSYVCYALSNKLFVFLNNPFLFGGVGMVTISWSGPICGDKDMHFLWICGKVINLMDDYCVAKWD